MPPHMRGEVTGCPECVQTYITEVRLLARMMAPVDGQVAGLGEALAAGFAGVRPLSGVKTLMDDEVAGRAEALLTDCTLVRTFAGVLTHVWDQMTGLFEPLAAHVATKRFLSGMLAHVNLTTSQHITYRFIEVSQPKDRLGPVSPTPVKSPVYWTQVISNCQLNRTRVSPTKVNFCPTPVGWLRD